MATGCGCRGLSGKDHPPFFEKFLGTRKQRRSLLQRRDSSKAKRSRALLSSRSKGRMSAPSNGKTSFFTASMCSTRTTFAKPTLKGYFYTNLVGILFQRNPICNRSLLFSQGASTPPAAVRFSKTPSSYVHSCGLQWIHRFGLHAKSDD